MAATAPIADLRKVPGHCSHCGVKLHCQASLDDGRCVGCRDKEKQVGPDRPKG